RIDSSAKPAIESQDHETLEPSSVRLEELADRTLIPFSRARELSRDLCILHGALAVLCANGRLSSRSLRSFPKSEVGKAARGWGGPPPTAARTRRKEASFLLAAGIVVRLRRPFPVPLV